MKKIALNLLSLSILAAITLPFLALAQIGGTPPTVNLNLTQLGVNIANAMWIIFTVAAVVAFVVAGILFLTAGGQPEKVATARSAAIWGIVGVVVGILAYTIITIGTSLVNSGT